MKQFAAILAALAVTFVIGVAIFMVGSNALINKNTVPVADSPNAANANIVPASVNLAQSNGTGDAQLQISQLQNLVQQYQAREKQYQSQLDNARQQISQASTEIQQSNSQLQQAQAQLQQYQALLAELEQRGLIRVDDNGNVTISGRLFH